MSDFKGFPKSTTSTPPSNPAAPPPPPEPEWVTRLNAATRTVDSWDPPGWLSGCLWLLAVGLAVMLVVALIAAATTGAWGLFILVAFCVAGVMGLLTIAFWGPIAAALGAVGIGGVAGLAAVGKKSPSGGQSTAKLGIKYGEFLTPPPGEGVWGMDFLKSIGADKQPFWVVPLAKNQDWAWIAGPMGPAALDFAITVPNVMVYAGQADRSNKPVEIKGRSFAIGSGMVKLDLTIMVRLIRSPENDQISGLTVRRFSVALDQDWRKSIVTYGTAAVNAALARTGMGSALDLTADHFATIEAAVKADVNPRLLPIGLECVEVVITKREDKASGARKDAQELGADDPGVPPWLKYAIRMGAYFFNKGGGKGGRRGNQRGGRNRRAPDNDDGGYDDEE